MHCCHYFETMDIDLPELFDSHDNETVILAHACFIVCHETFVRLH